MHNNLYPCFHVKQNDDFCTDTGVAEPDTLKLINKEKDVLLIRRTSCFIMSFKCANTCINVRQYRT